MKKLCAIFALTATLVACNTSGGTDQNPPSLKPNPQPPTATLYRGNWGWAAVNANNPDDYLTGIVSFSAEITNDQTSSAQYGKKIAAGLYDVADIDTKPIDVALMGAIASPLDAGFALGDRVLMVAADSDGAIGVSNSGQPLFSGPGRIYSSSGAAFDVVVAFVQTSNNPTYAAEDPRRVASKSFKTLKPTHFAGLKTARINAMSSIELSQRLATERRASGGTGALNDLLK